MNKKNFLILLIIVVLATIGCGKGVKSEDGKTQYTCAKKGIDRSTDTSGTSWVEDITYTAKLDDNNKLTYFSTLYHYTYNSKKDCDYWCDIKVEWNDEINDKNYSGGHRVTTCSCDKNELSEEFVYDDIPNLASILRSDITNLKSDNTFELDAWIQNREKYGYNCN